MSPDLQNPMVLWLILTAALAGLTYAFVRKELRVRVLAYGAFLIACGVAIWPPYEQDGRPGKIHLGLDLRGGIHLVLEVEVEDALNATVDDAVATTREQATRQGIEFGRVQRTDPTTFAVEGVEPARVKDMRDILRDQFGGTWQVQAAGEDGFKVQMTDIYQRQLRQQTVDEAMRTLQRRVNQLGVAEPVIARHGSTGDQILVQLPGVTDVEQAKRIIKTTAQLALRLVEDAAPSEETLLQSVGGKVPNDMEVLTGSGDSPGERTYYLVRREAMATGRDLKNARVGVDENNRPQINFTLNPTATDRFSRQTGRNIGRQLAIVLDGSVYSAPVIQSKLGADNRITGTFTTQEADELSKILKAGALPATLRYLQELTVGASLGRDSIRDGVRASVAAMAFIVIFMLVYYRLSGLNAVIALSANLLIVLAALAYSGATLTLPGIAGIILIVGVGVDTNVLVFERIREELRNGKTVRVAIQNGFDRVLTTIVDTHLTGLIAAAFLFQFGTGPIKGFAVTLVIGLVANVFASYFVSKLLFEWVLGKRHVEKLSI
ncbi:MAG: protein translocase subunit SecD [Acidobacteria bacterium]|jgi:preprotein translocase subunit SecD|nr:protein translocase subunit SecD [Acidobacteriota bacterium]